MFWDLPFHDGFPYVMTLSRDACLNLLSCVQSISDAYTSLVASST